MERGGRESVDEALVTSALREVCSGKGYSFVDRAESAAKGFEEPVRGTSYVTPRNDLETLGQAC